MSHTVKPAILLVGGLDPQGCAGISVDIQTVQHHDAHPVPLITCLTEQSSQGLIALGALTSDQFMAQYQCCVADFDISAIKIGLIPNIDIARCIKSIVEQHDVPVIFDPVLAATSGGLQANNELVEFIRDELLAKITMLTPNLPELAILSEGNLEVVSSSQFLLDKGLASCLVTGGHSSDEWATDYFVNGQDHFYSYQQKQKKSVRGTGCCFASSIASQLAFKQDIRDAVVLAKAYVSRGIRTAQTLGPYSVLSHSSAAVELQDMPKLCYNSMHIGAEARFPPCADNLGIYPVVDHVDWIDKLLDEGVSTLQLRMKEVCKTERVPQIEQAVNAAAKHNNTALFINDYWQDAIKAGAYGVHLGQEDLHDAQLNEIAQAGLRLGVSTHSYWELARALAINPSYIALGPIFETNSKQMPFSPQGIERLTLWVDMLSGHYPLVAIGGINLERAKQLKQTGVGSVAMISAITQADDYRHATRQLLECWQEVY
ncbi:MAG: thiamine phosphate synthase [Gammaproteobacteria bacterium]|nr:thiamine phosphate synthase [Gammaproteobacteria bacterium]